MAEALIALGGNVGDVRETLDRATAALCDGAVVRLVARSSDYRTPPWGVADQPPFINRAIIIETALPPLDLLTRAQAVDAAVATGFAMAVTYPRAGNIGGGGFMVIHLAGHNEDVAIDYRETAPAATTRDVFLGPDGKPDPAKSRDEGLAIGVPGTVAGLTLAHRKYGSGKFTLAQLMEPAITLARDGYKSGDEMADTGRTSIQRMARWPSTTKLFLKADGSLIDRGTLFVQSDLAATLDGIARNGASAFYEGPVADKISAAVREAGGLMTSDDLKNYKAVERPVLRGSYRGLSVVAMPPPSSGGAVLIEMLNVLEGFEGDVDAHGHRAVNGWKQAGLPWRQG